MSAPPPSFELEELEISPRLDEQSLRTDFVRKLCFELAKFPGVATRNDYYLALAYAVRDRLLDRWVRSARVYLDGRHRTVVYLSAEYLLGPQLGLNLMNLHIEAEAQAALRSLGLELSELIEPGLGNGGLGRLAACFMESLGHAAPAGHWLRHPLRARYLRSRDPRGLASRTNRPLATPGQSLGDPPLRAGVPRRLRGHHGARGGRNRQLEDALDPGAERAGRPVRHTTRW